jgi:hypothetical protein
LPLCHKMLRLLSRFTEGDYDNFCNSLLLGCGFNEDGQFGMDLFPVPRHDRCRLWIRRHRAPRAVLLHLAPRPAQLRALPVLRPVGVAC